jgi:hypothetical protein
LECASFAHIKRQQDAPLQGPSSLSFGSTASGLDAERSSRSGVLYLPMLMFVQSGSGSLSESGSIRMPKNGTGIDKFDADPDPDPDFGDCMKA